MVAGQAGLGKTTCLATLFDSHVNPPHSSEGRLTVFERTRQVQVYSFGNYQYY